MNVSFLSIPLRSSKIQSLLIASALLQLTACGTETSESVNIATPAIWAKMEINGRTDGSTSVTVELNVDSRNGNNLSLSENEYLEVSANGIVQRLNRDTDLFDIDYEGNIDLNDENTQFNISLFRSNGENITGSVANLPLSYEITAPLTPATFSVHDSIDVSWTPGLPDGNMTIDALVSCTTTDANSNNRHASLQFTVADSGSYTFNFSQHNLLNSDFNLDTTKPCELSFTLTRKSTGQIDTAFAQGSQFRTLQTREVEGFVVNLY
jgi:hypothetical protein